MHPLAQFSYRKIHHCAVFFYMSKEVLPPQEKVTWYICLRLPETLFPRLTFDTLNIYFLNDCETYWQLQATWKLKRHGDNAAQGKYNIANIKGNGSSTIKERSRAHLWPLLLQVQTSLFRFPLRCPSLLRILRKKGNITQHIQLLIQFTVILQADCGFVNSPLRLAYPHL